MALAALMVEALPRFSTMQVHEQIFDDVTSYAGRGEQCVAEYLAVRCFGLGRAVGTKT
jgi:hypothetical protein